MRGSGAVVLTFALTACGGGVELAGPGAERREGLRYSAELIEPGPEILIADAWIANHGRSERRLRFPDPCVALFRFYDAGNRLVWDQLVGNKTCVRPAVEI